MPSPGRRARAMYVFACLLATLPVWIPNRPVLGDIPLHAAQIAMLTRWNDPEWAFRDEFVLNLFTPYLFAYVSTWVLAQVLSVTLAVRVMMAASVVAFALSFSVLRREVGADPRWDWLVLPLPYSLAFQWGFYTFYIGAPFLFLFLAGCWRFQTSPKGRTGLALAAGATALFFIHALLAIFGCGIGVFIALASASGPRDLLRRTWPLVAPVPIALLWARHTRGGAAETDGIFFGIGPWRLVEALGFGFDLVASPGAIVVACVAVALPLVAGANPSVDKRRWAPLIAAALFFLLVPDYIFGNWFTYQRFACFLLPLYLIAFDSGAPAPIAEGVARVLPFVRLASVAIAFAQYDRDEAGFEDILADMEPDKRAVSLPFQSIEHSSGDKWPVNHTAAWYTVDKGGHVDFSAAAFYPQLVRFATPREAVDWALRLQSEPYDWQADRGWQYDYTIVRSASDRTAELFAGADCPIYLVRRSGPWWLYALDRGDPTDPTSCAARHPAAP